MTYIKYLNIIFACCSNGKKDDNSILEELLLNYHSLSLTNHNNLRNTLLSELKKEQSVTKTLALLNDTLDFNKINTKGDFAGLMKAFLSFYPKHYEISDNFKIFFKPEKIISSYLLFEKNRLKKIDMHQKLPEWAPQDRFHNLKKLLLTIESDYKLPTTSFFYKKEKNIKLEQSKKNQFASLYNSINQYTSKNVFIEIIEFMKNNAFTIYLSYSSEKISLPSAKSSNEDFIASINMFEAVNKINRKIPETNCQLVESAKLLLLVLRFEICSKHSKTLSLAITYIKDYLESILTGTKSHIYSPPSPIKKQKQLDSEEQKDVKLCVSLFGELLLRNQHQMSRLNKIDIINWLNRILKFNPDIELKLLVHSALNEIKPDLLSAEEAQAISSNFLSIQEQDKIISQLLSSRLNQFSYVLLKPHYFFLSEAFLCCFIMDNMTCYNSTLDTILFPLDNFILQVLFAKHHQGEMGNLLIEKISEATALNKDCASVVGKKMGL